MSKRSAYERLMGQNVGAVDILGDAAAVAEGPAETKVQYGDKTYSQYDEIMVGAGGTQSVAAGASGTFRGRVSSPFKTEQVCIPSDVASSLLITKIQIGPTILVDGDGVAADVFSEVSLQSKVNWPTAQVSQDIVIEATNIGAAAVVPRITLRGKRLR